MLSKFPRLIASALCLLAGLMAAWGFAPTELWWLMPACLAILVYFWCQARPKQAAWYGYCFGLGLYLHGTVWIVTLAHDFNGAAYWLAWLIHFIIACILASYIAVVGYLQAKLLPAKTRDTRGHLNRSNNSNHLNHLNHLTHQIQRPIWQRALLVSALWVLADWLRGNVLSNFPWLEIAYSQTGFALSAYAALGGIGMVSFVLILCAFCLVNVLSYLCSNCVRRSVKTFITLLLLFGVGAGLQTINWSRPIDQPFTAALVQANIPIQQKWQEQALDRVIRTYYRQTKDLNVDLAIWPETAVPTRLQRVDEAFWHKAASGELISGVEQVIEGTRYNAAIMTCRDQRQIYQKQRLVPFGEYIPFRFLTQFVAHYIGLEVHQYGHAEQSTVFDCDSLTAIGLSICFEIAFPRLIRQHALQSQVLVNISEDAWFGDAAATFQRLQMARMRAIEFSRPMLASSNSGPSAIIDHHGQIAAMSGHHVQQTVQGRVFPQQGMTPFLRWGDWFVLLCLAIAVMFLFWRVLIGVNNRFSQEVSEQ